ncbi:hypothetical protein ONZ43_g5815 [Nemania bipapillata]|uniref:Uncharacterized protein n=1 Tax=Nemania bipapillata TaxID=110536 RepID=A0ACC2I5M8_9PEZI|nr:hypothetical protein ONZ43_g5815 [Nemania bipapillata]
MSRNRSTTTRYEVEFANAVPLAAQDNVERQATEFRVVLNDGTPQQEIKYVSVSTSVRALCVKEEESGRVGIIQVPLLPGGDWLTADVGMTPDEKQIFITTTSCKPLPGVRNEWYEDSYEYVDLDIVPASIGTGRVKLVTAPGLDTPRHQAVMKFSPFPGGISRIEAETNIYQHIQKSTVAPKFLGHVKEDGRIIGFLIEYIEGARSPEVRDRFLDLALRKCKQTLEALHQLGVMHNDARPENCLLRRDGTAVLIDFELSTIATDGSLDGFERQVGYERDFQAMDPDHYLDSY